MISVATRKIVEILRCIDFRKMFCCHLSLCLSILVFGCVMFCLTRAVLRLVWPFDGIVQKHIHKSLH